MRRLMNARRRRLSEPARLRTTPALELLEPRRLLSAQAGMDTVASAVGFHDDLPGTTQMHCLEAKPAYRAVSGI